MKPLRIYGDHDDNTIAQMNVALETEDRAIRGVLCADGHLGYTVPIGGVIAYKNAISPSAVGFDIACGNAAVMTNLRYLDIRDDVERIMDEIYQNLSFGIGRVNQDDIDHLLFYDHAWVDQPVLAELKDLARSQLGTIGSGNHFVDLFSDDDERIWIGVHFGSRGFGHKIATHFIHAAGGKDGVNIPPAVMGFDTPLGQDYFQAMQLAGDYAYAGRDYVLGKVLEILGASNGGNYVHNNHNFAWLEEHNDEEIVVIRKGATPAFPGQRGFIGGSMGDVSFIIRGVDSAESRNSLYSTVHGAGRVMSRTKAAGRTKFKKGRRISVSDGLISREMMNEWIEREGVVLRGAGVDESPHCYRRLPDVIKSHGDTVVIEHVLHPIGVAMAGSDEYDPFKD